jgi:uncharacterized protein
MLALNAANETELSPLDGAALQHLVDAALYCGVIGPVGAPLGYLIVLDQGASYCSPNFLWFRNRLQEFAYVDRIAIDATVRGAGYARALYARAFDVARMRGHTVICSDKFHARLGFAVVGQAPLPPKADEPAKIVRYLQAQVT